MCVYRNIILQNSNNTNNNQEYNKHIDFPIVGGHYYKTILIITRVTKQTLISRKSASQSGNCSHTPWEYCILRATGGFQLTYNAGTVSLLLLTEAGPNESPAPCAGIAIQFIYNI